MRLQAVVDEHRIPFGILICHPVPKLQLFLDCTDTEQGTSGSRYQHTHSDFL